MILSRRTFFGLLAAVMLVPARILRVPEETPIPPVMISWRNYTASYDLPSKEVLIARMRDVHASFPTLADFGVLLEAAP